MLISLYAKKKRRKADLKYHIANNYLKNISLNGSFDESDFSNTQFIDNFYLFSNFNTIKINKFDEQCEFLKRYKQYQRHTNPNSNKLSTFISNEFHDYIEPNSELSNYNHTDTKLKQQTINTNDTYDKKTLEKANKTKSSNQRPLLEKQATLKSVINMSSAISSSIKTAKAVLLNEDSAIGSHPSSVLKQPILKNPSIDTDSNIQSDYLSKSLTTQMSRLVVPNSVHRTISESSNDSISFYNNIQGQRLATSRQQHLKMSIQNSLRRLNNEKVLFFVNCSAVCLFTRIPFTPSRKATSKQDLNESLQFNRTRNISINKSNSAYEQFIRDIFDLFDLDYLEYVNSELMSFEYLIDPKSYLKRINIAEETTSNDQIQCDRSDDDNEKSSDKEDFDIKLVQNLHKRGYNRRRRFSSTSITNFNDRKYNNSKENGICLALTYEANYLDDPKLTELTAGKNRTCLKFASYSVSIIDYVKPLDLKKEINEIFKEKFPHLQISLTKLRSIKNELYEIGIECSMDVVIIAQSYIYFERLILQGLINKANRKYLAGACLLISSKLNDLTKKEINRLVDVIVQKFRLDNRKDLIAFEFPILVALEFHLTFNYEKQLKNHYERITSNSYERFQNSKTNYIPKLRSSD